MKKGLLSLLALALTVVGCQNYDDQFEELTGLINDLASEVDDVAALQAQIVQTQSALSAIQEAVAGLENYDDTDLTNAVNASQSALEQQIGTVSATLASLLQQTNDIATSTDLNTISSTLADVQADVRELLEGDATINQNITINNEATLLYAETLVGTTTDDPNVIVNGRVTINTDGFSADQVRRTNDILAKLATILGNSTSTAGAGLSITSSHALSLPELTFLDDDYVINGGVDNNGNGVDDAELRTITGNLTTNEYGVIDYSTVTSVGDVIVEVTEKNSITRINFGSTSMNRISVGESLAFGTIDAPKADQITFVASATTIIADDATLINYNYNGTVYGALDITAEGDDSIINIAAEGVTGAITINGSTTSVVNADSLTTTNAFTMAREVSELHLDGIKSASGALRASTLEVPSLTYINAALEITADEANLDELDAVVGGGVLTLTGNTTATIKNMDATTVAASTKHLTVTGLASDQDLIFSATDHAALERIHITGVAATGAGAGAAQSNEVDVKALPAIIEVTLAGTIDEFDAEFTSANTTLKKVTTSGRLTDFAIDDAEELTTLSLGHNFISGDTAPTVKVINADELQSIDMSAIEKVRTIDLSPGNAKLHSIVAPSTASFFEPGASLTVDVSDGASLTADFSFYVPEIAATMTTSAVAAVPAKIHNSASLTSLKNYLDAILTNVPTAVASPNFVVDTQTYSGTTAYADFDTLAQAIDASYTASGTIGGTDLDVAAAKAEVDLIDQE